MKKNKNIILRKRLLGHSFWIKFIKRIWFKFKRAIFKSKIEIIQFPFKKWNIKTINSFPPEENGWRSCWHGYWEMEKTMSKEFDQFSQRIHNFQKGFSEEELERQCFLSIVNEIKDNEINMFELGAGTGRMSLMLAGIVDFNLIPNVNNKIYYCLAVEAEPTHYSWLVEHFKKQNVKGKTIHGAVSEKSGYVNFDISLDPSSIYGQTITQNSDYKIKSFTVDELINIYNFSKVNIIHVDVQGYEANVLSGAKNAVKQGLVDYWFIGTHERYLEEEIIKLTKSYYDIILYIPRRSGLIKHNVYGSVFIPSDGLLILKNKKIH